jgi:predicted GIY-YIG superfamily endonuclease
MPWTVYLARCRDGTLYTGITTDPERRLAEHNAGSGAAYTRSRLPVVFVYWETVADRSSALRREHAIKRLGRAAKESLVSGRKNVAGWALRCSGAHPAVHSGVSDGR